MNRKIIAGAAVLMLVWVGIVGALLIRRSSETRQAATSEDPVVEGAATLADLLTPEGFDYNETLEAIEQSALGPLEKSLLTGALRGARDNPELLREVLLTIREALEV